MGVRKIGEEKGLRLREAAVSRLTVGKWSMSIALRSFRNTDFLIDVHRVGNSLPCNDLLPLNDFDIAGTTVLAPTLPKIGRAHV